jgi:hypothetical protein
MTAASLVRRVAVFAFVLALVAPAPLLLARSKPDPDKYAHKVEKKLAHYKKGALLHLAFANNTESTGTLGEMADLSFKFVNVETNAVETHNYADVDSIGKGSETIGKVSRSHRGIL